MSRMTLKIEQAFRAVAGAVRFPPHCTRETDRAHAGDIEKILAIADAMDTIDRQKDASP